MLKLGRYFLACTRVANEKPMSWDLALVVDGYEFFWYWKIAHFFLNVIFFLSQASKSNTPNLGIFKSLRNRLLGHYFEPNGFLPQLHSGHLPDSGWHVGQQPRCGVHVQIFGNCMCASYLFDFAEYSGITLYNQLFPVTHFLFLLPNHITKIPKQKIHPLKSNA